MPVCAIHLLSLTPTTTIPSFLTTLHSQKETLKPLVISRVIRWIILPTSLSTDELLARNIHWDLLLVLPSTTPLPVVLQNLVAHQWTVNAGVPSRLLHNFPTKNRSLMHPPRSSSPPLTNSLTTPLISPSSQDLTLSPELLSWIKTFSSSKEGSSAVSMLNLLSFLPGKKDSYLHYGAEFARSIGSRRGGVAKIVGSVIHEPERQRAVDLQEVEKGVKGKGEEGRWDEVALAHYPSILHFADMLASADYQEVNQNYRVPSLRDTFILCTSEIGLDGFGGGGGAKL